MEELTEGDILQIGDSFVSVYTKKRERIEPLEITDEDLDFWESYDMDIKLVGLTTERHESLIKEKDNEIAHLKEQIYFKAGMVCLNEACDSYGRENPIQYQESFKHCPQCGASLVTFETGLSILREK
jgi:hypothetical protein